MIDPRIVDRTREPHLSPCGDCGREHMQGEHVAMTTPEGRRVWEGCMDCWKMRSGAGALLAEVERLREENRGRPAAVVSCSRLDRGSSTTLPCGKGPIADVINRSKLMRIRVAERQAGKTTELVVLMRYHPNAVMIVHSAKEATRIQMDYPHTKGRVFGPEQREALRAKPHEQVYVDNLDLILPVLLGVREVNIVTATGEAVE